MHVFIPVIISFLITSAVEMSQATTGKFSRCFPEWVNASKVRVICKKENDTNATQIAQYCNDHSESCRKMNTSGVSLEKDQDGLCLTINNDTYDSWSCEAVSYIDDNEQKENFTVDFSNQPINTSSSAGATDTEPKSAEGSTEGVIIGSIVLIVLIMLGLCIYKKKFSRKTTSHLNRENDMEMVERGETGENEPMRDDEVTLENEVLGPNGKTLENGELGENGETLALEQNGRQERRQAKNIIAPCATSSML